jgi:predicted TIM-barrel fold metal-dependent hydrolase
MLTIFVRRLRTSGFWYWAKSERSMPVCLSANPKLESFLELAERFDIPVAVHTGIAPPQIKKMTFVLFRG